MTRTTLKALFFLLLRQKSTNTEISDGNLNTLLDAAYQKAMEDIQPEGLNTETVYTIPRTTFSSRTNATTVVVASATNFAANTDIVIYEGSRYDTLRIQSITSNTLTLVSPGLIYTGFTTAAVVVPVSVIVSDWRDIIGLGWEYNTTTKRERYPMFPARHHDFVEHGSLQKSTGTPSRYGFFNETEMMIYPIPDAAGYIYVTNKNKTTYTFSEDASTVSFLDNDAQYALVYWTLFLTALRNKEWKDAIEGYYPLYQATVENARKDIRKRKEGNHGWNLKLSDLQKRA